jgi:hypothetical protein
VAESELQEQIRNAVRRDTGVASRRADFDLGVDYLEDRMYGDVEAELMLAFPAANNTAGDGDAQKMRPFAVPLAQRFVAETATLYNNPLSRELVDRDGNKLDELTIAFNRALRDINFDEFMLQVDRTVALLLSCGIWTQVKRGALAPSLVLPQLLTPVLETEGTGRTDRSDPDDYAGYVVELSAPGQHAAESNGEYAYVSAQATEFYKGTKIEDVRGLKSTPNPFTWMQAEETEDGSPSESERPLQPMVVAAWPPQRGRLLPLHDVSIARINREINVYLSSFLDTIRFQSYAVPYYQSTNPAQAPSSQPHGVRHPRVLRSGETFGYVTANIPYSELVETLNSLVKLQAVATRQSPNEFALGGSSPESGFAKLIDSLPAIKKRAERERHFKQMEESRLWPRLASQLIYLGKLPPTAKDARLRVEFSPIEIPRSVIERTTEEEHDIKHGMTTPARLLAKRLGISVAEAQAQIDENKKAAPTPAEAAAPGQGREEMRKRFGGGIGGKRS